MYPMKPDKDAWFEHGYGMTKDEFKRNLSEYRKHYPNNVKKIHYLDPQKKYKFKLAYSFFLAETYTLLPFFEKNKTPFVFCLYPGGAFGLNNEKSDAMLKKIAASNYCRGVIATQKITKDYLIEKAIFNEDKIRYIYGGFVQFSEAGLLPSKKFGRDKSTLDVCFVAKKYSERGVDKGYDIFIETAKKVIDQTENINFHVVGNFTKKDISIVGYENRIVHYGLQQPENLKVFYSTMDIYVSPNRPHKLFEGNFDGFPLGGDAGYLGVARFVSDELGMNDKYIDTVDIVIIKLNSDEIAKKIIHYRNQPNMLISIAQKGQKKTQKLLNRETQIRKRLDFFSEFVEVKT